MNFSVGGPLDRIGNARPTHPSNVQAYLRPVVLYLPDSRLTPRYQALKSHPGWSWTYL